MEQLMRLASLTSIRNYLETKGVDFVANLAAAIVILVVGRFVARFLSKAVVRLLERSGTDTTLVRFLKNLCYGVLMVFVVLAALERLGVNTTSFAAIIGAAGLAIGLALQGSLSNFAAGVMIILMRHFSVGDVIEAGGQSGTVTDIQIFNSVLTAADGTKIILPNGAITGGTIKVFPKPGSATPAKAA